VISDRDRKYHVAALLLVLFGLVACGADKAPEFCKNHAPFHKLHSDELGSLKVILTVDGSLHSEIRLPVAAISSDAGTLLETVSNVYTLQSESECAPLKADVTRQGGILAANYETSCGAGNKLGQLHIHLFDSLPLLEEIEVTVTTPVAEKHFAINRQCESAIFRLK
jgi:hypothetical protein